MHIILTCVYKGQLLIKATFSGSLEWPLYTGLIVFVTFSSVAFPEECFAYISVNLYLRKYTIFNHETVAPYHHFQNASKI